MLLSMSFKIDVNILGGARHRTGEDQSGPPAHDDLLRLRTVISKPDGDCLESLVELYRIEWLSIMSTIPSSHNDYYKCHSITMSRNKTKGAVLRICGV